MKMKGPKHLSIYLSIYLFRSTNEATVKRSSLHRNKQSNKTVHHQILKNISNIRSAKEMKVQLPAAANTSNLVDLK